MDLFGEVIYSDTLQFVFVFNKDNFHNNLQIDVVVKTDSAEYHSEKLFHTYEWSYHPSLVSRTVKEDSTNSTVTQTYNIDLKKLYGLFDVNNNSIANIEMKMRWYNLMPQDTNVYYTINLLNNGETKYTENKTVNLLTNETFPVDVLYKKVFETSYDVKHDTIILKDYGKGDDMDAAFEYDLTIKNNSTILVNQHFKANSSTNKVILGANDFHKGDKFSFEVTNFKILLSHISLSSIVTSTDIIIPNFIDGNVTSEVKNNYIISRGKNGNSYVFTLEILEDIPITTTNQFSFMNIGLCMFDSIYYVFSFTMNQYGNYESTCQTQNIDKSFNIIKLFP